MKVFEVDYDGCVKRIVAAKNMEEAAKLIGCYYSRIIEFGCEIQNEEEVTLALRIPNQVWEKPYIGKSEWQMVMPL